MASRLLEDRLTALSDVVAGAEAAMLAAAERLDQVPDYMHVLRSTSNALRKTISHDDPNLWSVSARAETLLDQDPSRDALGAAQGLRDAVARIQAITSEEG